MSTLANWKVQLTNLNYKLQYFIYIYSWWNGNYVCFAATLMTRKMLKPLLQLTLPLAPSCPLAPWAPGPPAYPGDPSSPLIPCGPGAVPEGPLCPASPLAPAYPLNPLCPGSPIKFAKRALWSNWTIHISYFVLLVVLIMIP